MRGQPEGVKLSLRAFTAGTLLTLAVEKIAPEAHEEPKGGYESLVLVGDLTHSPGASVCASRPVPELPLHAREERTPVPGELAVERPGFALRAQPHARGLQLRARRSVPATLRRVEGPVVRLRPSCPIGAGLEVGQRRALGRPHHAPAG